MTMPNFLVIGAAKSGTTALYYYLKQHPQVYVSGVKEPHFFAYDSETPNWQGPVDPDWYTLVSDIEAYRGLFGGVSKEVAIGEASTHYLYLPKAHDRIRHHVPEVKLIAVLREPAERAYSNFLYLSLEGKEPLIDFAQALQEEEYRIQNNWAPIWHYKQKGFYYTQLKRYYDVFEREQIRVYLYEDLNENPAGVLRDVYKFLGVDSTFVPDISMRYNASGVPKNERVRVLYNFLNRPHPVKSVFKPLFPKELRRRLRARSLNALRNRYLAKPPFPVEVRQQLAEEYKEDVLKLQGLIQRDLSKWLR